MGKLGAYILVFGTGLLFAPLISALVASYAFKLSGPRAYGSSLLAYFGFAFAFASSTNSGVNEIAFWFIVVPFCYVTFSVLSFVVFFLDKKDVDGKVISVGRLMKVAIVTVVILVAVNPYSYLVFTPRP